jgi:hypothetical protein
MKTITLTDRQAKLLATLLHDISGQVQYRAIKTWHRPECIKIEHASEAIRDIAIKVAESVGMDDAIMSGLNPPASRHVSTVLAVVRREL